MAKRSMVGPREVFIGNERITDSDLVFSSILKHFGIQQSVSAVLANEKLLEETIDKVRNAIKAKAIRIGAEGGPCGLDLEGAIKATRELGQKIRLMEKHLPPEVLAILGDDWLADHERISLDLIVELTKFTLKQLEALGGSEGQLGTDLTLPGINIEKIRAIAKLSLEQIGIIGNENLFKADMTTEKINLLASLSADQLKAISKNIIAKLTTEQLRAIKILSSESIAGLGDALLQLSVTEIAIYSSANNNGYREGRMPVSIGTPPNDDD